MTTEAKSAFVVAVTGHRPDKLGGYNTPNPLYDLVIKGLVDAFEKLKPAYVISGMALGVDQWAAEVCLNMGIPFVAAIPFIGQEKIWPPKSQIKYHLLLSKAFAKYVICEEGFAPWKMKKRNEWMVDSCQQVVAVWNGTKGGTASCVEMAHAKGKPIHYVQLPPPGMEVGDFYQKLVGEKSTIVDDLLKEEAQKEKTVVKPGTKRIVEL
jgi:uncharacterized phage-like protein YoqJ